MFCYHNENTDFANLKFVLIISYKDLVTHYNIYTPGWREAQ